MPELPEVEVVKRSLERKTQNLIIKKVEIYDGNLRYKVNKDEIQKLSGKKFKKIYRRSKFLIFKIDHSCAMLVHLGMTGKFFFIDNKKIKYKTSFYYSLNEKKDKKHDRVVFIFKDNQKLIYNDIRKFGFIKFFHPNNNKKIFHLNKLGPEPLEKKYNLNYLRKYISGRKRNIKDILMDQRCVSGLGNIYVNEILFLSKVKPTRQVINLKNSEINNIVENTKKILKIAIKYGGSSIKNFSNEDGKKGDFQQHFNVYGRKGKKCSNVDCNQNITRIVVSNRATFFCEKCQK